MTDFGERLKALNVTSKRGPKGCLELASVMHPEFREELYECFWFEGSAVAASVLLKQEMGINIPEYTIRRHRRGICRCPAPFSTPPEDYRFLYDYQGSD